MIETHNDSGELLVVSDGAAAKIAELLAEDGGADRYLRVYVNGGGCSGFQYGFAFEESPQEDDACVRKGGVALLVDPISLQYLAGAAIEYEDGLEGARFVIRNPNATSTCGCGSSFSV
jgi:iron-sulfur cluster insertion protein